MSGYQPTYDERKAASVPRGGTAVRRRCEHAFEARHDEFSVGDLRKKIYVRDVCTKCGETVER